MKFFEAVFVFLFVWAIEYLICAVIAANFNPMDWSGGGRILFGIITPIIAVLITNDILAEYFD